MKKMTIPKPLRCAIYTRKSTEHNLDLAFNSLDAHGKETCPKPIRRLVALDANDVAVLLLQALLDALVVMSEL
jgi:hypothetical protein